MSDTYMHGTYGTTQAVGTKVAQASQSAIVYVGTAPVHLTANGAELVNKPVVVYNMAEARRYFGYSDDWAKYTLCEAMDMHFEHNGVGPLVLINVLDPAKHKSAEAGSVSLTPENGRIIIANAEDIILSSVKAGEMTAGTDYTIAYDQTKKVIILTEMTKGAMACIVLAIAGATTIMIIPVESVRGTPFKRIETWQSRISKYMPFGEKQEEKKVDDGKDDQRKYANIAIASSGIIFGKGPGNSEEREYLPEAYSDLIYAIIIEEWGLIIGCVGLLILYLTLLFHTGQIAKNCDDPFAAYLIMGAALLIGIQAMIHMSISTGLFPISGQPLPLISRGGSSLIVNSVYIGMILSVSRYAGKLKAEKEKRNYTPAE